MSCEHCIVSKPFVVADEDIGGLDVRIDGDKLVVRYYDGHVLCDDEVIRIGFCPKCGEALPVARDITCEVDDVGGGLYRLRHRLDGTTTIEKTTRGTLHDARKEMNDMRLRHGLW